MEKLEKREKSKSKVLQEIEKLRQELRDLTEIVIENEKRLEELRIKAKKQPRVYS